MSTHYPDSLACSLDLSRTQFIPRHLCPYRCSTTGALEPTLFCIAPMQLVLICLLQRLTDEYNNRLPPKRGRCGGTWRPRPQAPSGAPSNRPSINAPWITLRVGVRIRLGLGLRTKKARSPPERAGSRGRPQSSNRRLTLLATTSTEEVSAFDVAVESVAQSELLYRGSVKFTALL